MTSITRIARRATCFLVGLCVVAVGSIAAVIDPTHIDDFSGLPRVIVISDIGNEPDDQMSLVRFLMYSNEFDIEGLIAATSTWQRSVHPETMHTLIRAYAEVRNNLMLHSKGPQPNCLTAGYSLVRSRSV